jgi:hypothetical protein
MIRSLAEQSPQGFATRAHREFFDIGQLGE